MRDSYLKTTGTLFIFFAVLFGAPRSVFPFQVPTADAQQETTRAPLIPAAANVSSTTVQDSVHASGTISSTVLPPPPESANDRRPIRLIIPSIGLDAPVKDVGVNEIGEMDVPDGSSNQVGWYASGTVPGDVGSAVMDAHVFAAFAKLRYVKTGSDIYVIMKSGKKRHFIVRESLVYRLGQLSPDLLFNRTDARRLNLITCAGSPTVDGSTYDHRLVVYATLVQ